MCIETDHNRSGSFYEMGVRKDVDFNCSQNSVLRVDVLGEYATSIIY